jgi:hypothetical protein
MQTPGIDTALCQISYGFRKRVTTYGCYDVNGYRFRSKELDDTTAVVSDEIIDPKELEFLSKLNTEGEGNVDDGQEEEDDEESQDEEDEESQDEEHLALDPNDY